MVYKMRTARSASLFTPRYIPPIQHQIPIRQAILIQSLTHHNPTWVIPAHVFRLSSFNISHKSVRKFSTRKSPPVSSPSPNQDTTSMRSESKQTTSPEASTTAMPLTAPTDLDDNVNHETDTNAKDVDGPQQVYENWEPTINHLVAQVHSAWSASPPTHSTATQAQISEFMAYWRSIFEKIAAEVESDDSLPQYLTNPPASRFDVLLFTQNSGLDCPCCLPEVGANIILQTAEDGVGITKADLVRAVGKYLYGLDIGTSSESKVKITFDGGEFRQTGDKVTLPTIYSEYELLTREEYPDYLIKKGSHEWTLQEQLDDMERPLGGWSLRGWGATNKKPDDYESAGATPEQEAEKEDVGLVEDMAGVDLDAKSVREDTAAHESESGNEQVAVNTTMQAKNGAEKSEKELATGMDNSHGKEEESGAPELGQMPDVESVEGPVSFFEEFPAEYKFPAVLWDSSWLSAGGGGPNGERIVYGRTPTVWLFCCVPGDFEDRVGTERFKQKRRNREERSSRVAKTEVESKD